MVFTVSVLLNKVNYKSGLRLFGIVLLLRRKEGRGEFKMIAMEQGSNMGLSEEGR